MNRKYLQVHVDEELIHKPNFKKLHIITPIKKVQSTRFWMLICNLHSVCF